MLGYCVYICVSSYLSHWLLPGRVRVSVSGWQAPGGADPPAGCGRHPPGLWQQDPGAHGVHGEGAQDPTLASTLKKLISWRADPIASEKTPQTPAGIIPNNLLKKYTWKQNGGQTQRPSEELYQKPHGEQIH